jgi:arginyl-tRNA synthetase
MDIAREIINQLPDMPEFAGCQVAAPGFINFSFSLAWLSSQTAFIFISNPPLYQLDIGKGVRIQVEFVSVNPTGPLHVGHGRGAVLGSALANVLAFCGYDVSREYYINDAGNQIDAFKRSLFVRYQQHFGRAAEMPEEGYQGNYMSILATNIAQQSGR